MGEIRGNKYRRSHFMRDPKNPTTKNRYKISSQIFLKKTRLLNLLQPILHPPLTKLLLLQKPH